MNIPEPFEGDGITKKFEVPVVVMLYEHTNFQGVRRVFIRNQPNLGGTWQSGSAAVVGPLFGDTASSAAVHPGPDYESWKQRHNGREPTVTLWRNMAVNLQTGEIDYAYAGDCIPLQTGIYPDLGALALGGEVINFKDQAHALRFEQPNNMLTVVPPAGPAAPIAPIPLVLRLHSAGRDRTVNVLEVDYMVTLVESCRDIEAELGSLYDPNTLSTWSWKENITRIDVLQGPDWTETSRVQFFAQPD
jgi:hypothetical protein